MAQTVILAFPAPHGPPNRAEYRGKFLPRTLRDVQYPILAPGGLYRFHNQILAQFLTEQNIPHRRANDQTLEMTAPDLAVIGVGKFRVNTENKIPEVWNDSQAHGHFDERGLPEKTASAHHPWSALKFRVS